MIAALIAGRVTTSLPGTADSIDPVFYTFLVAGSGMGKSQAIQYGVRYFGRYQKIMGIFNGSLNPQTVKDLLSTSQEETGTARLFLVRDELATMQQVKGGGHALIQIMTDLGTGLRGLTSGDLTRKHGRVEYDDPLVCGLFGSTPEWMADTIGVANIRGGLLGRIIPVYEPGRYRVEYMEGWYDERHQLLREMVQAQIDSIANLSRNMGARHLKWGPGCHELFKEWREKHFKHPVDQDLDPWTSRADIWTVKFAMVYAAAELGQDVHTLERRHFEQAQIDVEAIMYNDLQKAVRKIVATEGNLLVSKMRRILKNAGELHYSSLRQRMGSSVDADKYNAVLNVLLDCGDARLDFVPGKAGRGKVIWLGTEAERVRREPTPQQLVQEHDMTPEEREVYLQERFDMD
jgi:hypothetical protein